MGARSCRPWSTHEDGEGDLEDPDQSAPSCLTVPVHIVQPSSENTRPSLASQLKPGTESLLSSAEEGARIPSSMAEAFTELSPPHMLTMFLQQTASSATDCRYSEQIGIEPLSTARRSTASFSRRSRGTITLKRLHSSWAMDADAPLPPSSSPQYCASTSPKREPGEDTS